MLIGVAGASLIGAAIYAALDQDGFFAMAPEFAVPPQASYSDQSVNPGKGDLIAKRVDLVAIKHIFRAAVTVKIGPKEVIRQREFTRVDTPLTLAPLGFADQIPPFNPLRLLADPGASTPAARSWPGFRRRGSFL